MAENKKRIPEFDIAKGIAIMAVMMAHLASEYRLIKYGLAFLIVTFFTVSGILEKDYIQLKDIIKKRSKSILYPYCTMSLIYILIYSVVKLIKNHSIPVNFIAKNLYFTLSGSGIGTLWFLPAAFIGAVIYAFVKQKFSNKAPGILIALMVLCVVIGRVLYEIDIFGSIQYTLSGVLTNELQVLIKGCIAAGFMQIGRYIWNGILYMEKKLVAPLFYLGGGVYG